MILPWVSRSVIRSTRVKGEKIGVTVGNYWTKIDGLTEALIEVDDPTFLDLCRVIAKAKKERARLRSLQGKP